MVTALLLVASSVWAQEGPWWMRCSTYTELEGLPSNAIRDRALRDNVQLYGVLETAEQDLFPLLGAGDPDDPRAVVEFGMRSLWGAERLPALEVRGSDCGPAHAPVDVYTSSFGLGFRAGPVGLYYATVVQGRMVTVNPAIRAYGTWQGSAFGMLYAPVAPFVGSGGTNTLRWDWLLGAEVHPGSMTARVGYLGSKGIYTNVDERWTALFLKNAIRPVVQEVRAEAAELQETHTLLPYLAAGVDRLPLPADARAVTGSTRLFGRKLTWYTRPPPPPEEVNPDEDPRESVDIDLWSGHLEQYDIAGLVDVRAAWTIRPQSQLHELVVAIHTPYWQSPELGDAWEGMTARLQVGATQVPAAWYYGVKPGMKPTLGLDVGWGTPDLGKFGLLKVRMNHVDVLDLFPYAVGALSIQAEFGLMRL